MTFVNILKSTALLLRVSFVLCELSPNTSPISCPWTTLVPCLFLRKTLLINPNQKLGGLFPINSLRIFEVWKPWAVHEYHDAFTKSRVVPNSPFFATQLWHPHPRGNHFSDCSHYSSVWYLLQCHGNSIMHPESWYDTVSEVHSCYHTHPELVYFHCCFIVQCIRIVQLSIPLIFFLLWQGFSIFYVIKNDLEFLVLLLTPLLGLWACAVMPGFCGAGDRTKKGFMLVRSALCQLSYSHRPLSFPLLVGFCIIPSLGILRIKMPFFS